MARVENVSETEVAKVKPLQDGKLLPAPDLLQQQQSGDRADSTLPPALYLLCHQKEKTLHGHQLAV